MTEQEKIERRRAQIRESAARRRERLRAEGYFKFTFWLTDEETEKVKAFLTSFRQQGVA